MSLSTWLVLGGGLLAGIAGADLSGHERFAFLSGPKWKRAKAIALLLGVVAIFGGSALSEREKARSEADRNRNEAEFRRQLSVITGQQTGGDSFCYVVPSVKMGSGDIAPLMLVQQGEYALYNVKVMIHDLEAPLPTTFHDILARTPVFDVPELAHTALLLHPRWQLSPSGKQDYTIQIGARNGWLTQAIRMRKVSGRWLWHTVVFRTAPTGNNVELLRQADDGFPREALVGQLNGPANNALHLTSGAGKTGAARR